jgi:hypothetical protein
MDEPMVEVAEGKQVMDIALPAARPKLNVMRIRPIDRPVAFWKAARPVSGFERSPLRRRDGSRRPADVDHD